MQQQRTAINDGTDFLKALVIVGLKIDVVCCIGIQQDLPGGHANALSIKPVGAFGKAFPVSRIEGMNGSFAHSLNVLDIFKGRRFLKDRPRIAPAYIVGHGARCPQGVSQKLFCITPNFERLFSHQNSTLA